MATQYISANSTLKLWQRLAWLPAGKWLFSRGICFKAPYFGSISPAIKVLEAGRCEVQAKNRRKVHNHLGTFHAIAACNMAEVAAGVMMEATVPASHRWIPKGMTVKYLAKATTDLAAVTALERPLSFGADAEDVVVPVNITDSSEKLVVFAEITMYVSPKN